jgi:iron complex transport system permease protein
VYFLLLALLAVTVLAVSIFMGRYPEPPGLTVSQLLQDPMAQTLVLNLRLPRIILAFLLGSSLSMAGVVMQTLFHNPLVEPGFLGVSQGAAFGAAFSILFITQQPAAVVVLAFVFGLSGLFLTVALGGRSNTSSAIVRLVLAGIAVSALFSAGVGFLKYLADPVKQLPEIVFWLLGGLSSINWQDVTTVLPVVVIGTIVIFIFRWRLNVIALDDPIAKSLGVNVRLERTTVLIAAVAITASVISVAGIIGWVGLIVPHIMRLIIGGDTKRLIPFSFLAGGIFTVICDDATRTISTGEIPLGIVTSLFGSIIFLALLLKGNLLS